MKTTRRLVLSLALLSIFHSPFQSLAMTYSIKGNLTYQVFALQKEGEPRALEPLLREFEVLVDDSAWKIRMVLVGNTNFDSFIYSYDGTNMLHYALPKNYTAMDGANPMVSIDPSPVPATATTAGGEYVWLALASGGYFKTRTNGTAQSFERAHSSQGLEKTYEQPIRVLLSSSPAYLPTTIQYLSTNLGMVLRDDGNVDSLPLPPPFKADGYTSAELKSGSFTNVQGRSFPTTFEYLRYRPNPNAKTTNDVSCTVIVKGNVTSITTAEKGVDCALPGRGFMIRDLRFPEPRVLYPSSNGQIPEVDSEVARTARERAVRQFKALGK